VAQLCVLCVCRAWFAVHEGICPAHAVQPALEPSREARRVKPVKGPATVRCGEANLVRKLGEGEGEGEGEALSLQVRNKPGSSWPDGVGPGCLACSFTMPPFTLPTDGARLHLEAGKATDRRACLYAVHCLSCATTTTTTTSPTHHRPSPHHHSRSTAPPPAPAPCIHT